MARSPKGGHELTREDSRKGGQARALKLQAEREEARRRSLERAAGMLDAALDAMEDSLGSDDERLRFSAARSTLDRLLGRPVPGTGLVGGNTPGSVTVMLDAQLGPWTKWASDDELDAVEGIIAAAEARREAGRKPPVKGKRPARTGAKPARKPSPKASDTPTSRQRQAKRAKPARARPSATKAPALPERVAAAVAAQQRKKAERQADEEAKAQRRKRRPAEPQERGPRGDGDSGIGGATF